MAPRLACSILLLLGGLIHPIAALGQAPVRIPRIGYISTNLSANPHIVEAFRLGLRDLGYVEGRNLFVEYRSAGGRLETFPTIAAELVALKVDLIVAANTQAALAAKHATGTIPIVFVGPPDPVSSELVASLAHPGAHVTGVSSLPTPELLGKTLELLAQAVPGRSRVAALWHRDYPEHTQKAILGAVDSAARTLGLQLLSVEARGGPENFERAFADIARSRADALDVLPSVLFVSERRRLVDLAAKYRLPAVWPVRDFVDDGGLMSYGPLWADLYRHAAAYVDKILKGATPGDLPVEQPTRFELIINLKAARALGVTVPRMILLRADQVIE